MFSGFPGSLSTLDKVRISPPATISIAGDSIWSTYSNFQYTPTMQNALLGYTDAAGPPYCTTNNNSIANWACAQSKGQLVMSNPGAAMDGWTTSDVDSFWSTGIASKKPNFVVLQIGFNDFGGSSNIPATIAALKVWVASRCAEIQSWGGIPILCTIEPMHTSYPLYSATKRLGVETYNGWLRNNAKALGAEFFDFYQETIDPASASGNTLASYSVGDATGVHPCNAYRRIIGAALWSKVLANYFGSVDTYIKGQFAAVNSGLLYTDPLLQTTSGNVTGLAGGGAGSVLPAGFQAWNTATQTTCTMVAAADGIGKAINLSQAMTAASVGAASPGILLDFSAMATAQNGGVALNAGDQVRMSCKIDVTSSASFVGPHILLGIFGSIAGQQCNIAVGCTNNQASNQTSPDTSPWTAYFTSPIVTLPVGFVYANAFAFFQGPASGAGTNVWQISRLKIENMSKY